MTAVLVITLLQTNSDNSEDEGVSLDNDDDENLEPVKKVPSCSA